MSRITVSEDFESQASVALPRLEPHPEFDSPSSCYQMLEIILVVPGPPGLEKPRFFWKKAFGF